MDGLTETKSVCIKRAWYKVSTVDADADLDTFFNVSVSGYGAVAYRRVETEDEVDVAFLAGKSHVVPLDKSSHLGSMPRLELSGGVKGIEVKLDLQQLIMKPFREIRIWTDSYCLLKWVWNNTVGHKVYVSNRLAKIHKSSEKEQWKFFDSERNPADLYQGRREREVGFLPERTTFLVAEKERLAGNEGEG